MDEVLWVSVGLIVLSLVSVVLTWVKLIGDERRVERQFQAGEPDRMATPEEVKKFGGPK